MAFRASLNKEQANKINEEFIEDALQSIDEPDCIKEVIPNLTQTIGHMSKYSKQLYDFPEEQTSFDLLDQDIASNNQLTSKYESDYIMKTCREIYNSHIKNNPINLDQQILHIKQFSVENSKESSLRILLSFCHKLPSIFKFFKDQVNEIQDFKKMFDTKLESANEEKECKCNCDVNESSLYKEKDILIKLPLQGNNTELRNNNNQLQQYYEVKKENQFNELNKMLELTITKLTNLYTALLDSTSEINSLFEAPLSILFSASTQKFDFGKIHKEEFFSVIYKDDFIRTVITEINKKGAYFPWVDNIIAEVKSSYEQQSKELARMELFITIELDNIRLNSIKRKSKETVVTNIPIDDLVKYINEATGTPRKPKKGKKRISKEKQTIYLPSENGKYKVENELSEIKNSMKESSMPANIVHKIKANFTKEWLYKITNHIN